MGIQSTEKREWKNRVAIYKGMINGDMRDGRSFWPLGIRRTTYLLRTFYHDIRALAVIANRYFSPSLRVLGTTKKTSPQKNPHSTPYNASIP